MVAPVCVCVCVSKNVQNLLMHGFKTLLPFSNEPTSAKGHTRIGLQGEDDHI